MNTKNNKRRQHPKKALKKLFFNYYKQKRFRKSLFQIYAKKPN